MINLGLAALINGAILSVLVTAAVWFALRLTPRRLLNAATRHAVWWLTLAVVVTLPAVYVPLPHAPRSRPASRVEAEPGPVRVSRSVSQLPSSSRTSIVAATTSLHWIFPVEIPSGPWTKWIPITWASATLLMLAWLAASIFGMVRRKAHAMPAPRHLAERVPRWLAQCGSARRRVRLAGSNEISTPMAAGLWRPFILIPARLFDRLQEGDLDQIGVHEAAHFARWDDYALIAQRLLEALFVLHPVVHWIARRIEMEREIACDDFVVRITGKPRAYAACLTRVVELAGEGRATLIAVAATEQRSNLSRRVDMLLDGTRHAGTGLLKVRLAAAIGSLLLLVWVAARVPGTVAFADPIPQSPPPKQTARAAPAPEPVAEPAPSAEPEPQQPAAPAPRPVAAIKVQISVSVTDPLNRFVTGLSKENFKLLENGKEQEILEFSAGDKPPDAQGFAFNFSDRIPGALEAARDAYNQFLKAANLPEIQTVQLEPAEREELLRRLGAQPSLPRPFLEVVSGFLPMNTWTNRANAPGAFVIFSDGGRPSAYTDAEVRNAVGAGTVPIYVIGIAETPEARALFDRVAAETGGRHLAVEKLEDFADVARKLAVQFRNEYVLGYAPKNPTQDGSFRAVQVQVVAPQGLPPLRTWSRSGYYATSR
ncbi:MAG TPA: M56 family metallopeptidase [Bryobacteraceae bacterium]|nr:M56 family metallopeptidase [Bryobacteraceae bacterium]